MSSRDCFTDEDGSVRWVDLKSKTLYMPYNIPREDYSKEVNKYIEAGYVVQLEII